MPKPIPLYISNNWEQYNLLDPSVFTVVPNMVPKIINGKLTNVYVITTVQSHFKDVYTAMPAINMYRKHEFEYLNDLQQAGITVPPYYYSYGSEIISTVDNFMDLYMVKTFMQSRSMGKDIVTVDILEKMIECVEQRDSNYKEFNDIFAIDVGKTKTDNEDATLYNAIKHRVFYLSKIVEFHKEYRILYMKGIDPSEYIVEYREGYKPRDPIERLHKPIDDFDREDILNKIKEFGDSSGSPALSFDVYIQDGGEWGCFEYSTQFGVDYPLAELVKIRKQFTEAMLLAIKEHPYFKDMI